MDNPQVLLHHLLQEYLAERDINFILVNLRCLLQTISCVTYWQGVGGKLSRAIYLAPRQEFQTEWIISNFLLHRLLQKYLVERDINFISVIMRCLLQTFSWVTYWQGVGWERGRVGGGKITRDSLPPGGASCPGGQDKLLHQLVPVQQGSTSVLYTYTPIIGCRNDRVVKRLDYWPRTPSVWVRVPPGTN